MLVAREALNLTRELIEDFAKYNGAGNAVPIKVPQSQYISIVCMLRAVGHVLIDDCESSPARARHLKEKWKIWAKEPVFAKFIKPTRDDLLKEFKGGLRLEDQEGATLMAMSGARGVERAGWFDASTVKDNQGRPVLSLLRDGVKFWERVLADIEAVTP